MEGDRKRLEYPQSASEAIEDLKSKGVYYQEEHINITQDGIFLGVKKDPSKPNSQDATCCSASSLGNVLFGVFNGVSLPSDRGDSSFAAWHTAEKLKKPLVSMEDIRKLLEISDEKGRQDELKKKVIESLQEVSRKLPEGDIGETTLSFGEIVRVGDKRYLIGVNIGDSRIYIGKRKSVAIEGEVSSFEEKIELEQLTLDNWVGWDSVNLPLEEKLKIQKILSQIEDYKNPPKEVVSDLQKVFDDNNLSLDAKDIIKNYSSTRNSIPKSFKRNLGEGKLNDYTQVFIRELEPGDVVLATTDGIHDVLTDQEIEAVISEALEKGTNPSEALIKKASEKDGPRAKKDDRGVVVIELGKKETETELLSSESGESEGEIGGTGGDGTEDRESVNIGVEALLGGGFMIGLKNVMDILLNRVGLEGEEKESLKKSIADAIKDKTEGLFDEEKIISAIEDAVSSPRLDEDLKKRILDSLIEKDDEGNKNLKSDVLAELMPIFKKEGRGLNYRDKITNVEEVKAYLYLLLPEGESTPELKSAFERLVTEKSGARLAVNLFPPRLRRIPTAAKDDFIKDLTGYLDNLRQGKNRITFYFDKSLVSGQISEEILSKEDVIKKKGDTYEMYITPDKQLSIMNKLIRALVDVEKTRIDIAKLFPRADELLNRAKKKFKDSPEIIASIAFLLQELKKQYQDRQRAGASSEELNEIKKGIESVIGMLDGVVAEEKKEKAVNKIKDWWKGNAGTILGLLGTGLLMWGALLLFYIPVLIMSKAEKEVGGLGIKI